MAADYQPTYLFSLLSRAAEIGLSVFLEHGRLAIRAPVESLDCALITELRSAEHAIAAALGEPEFLTRSRTPGTPTLLSRRALCRQPLRDEYDETYWNSPHWATKVRIARAKRAALQACVDSLLDRYPILGSRLAEGNGDVELRFGERVQVEFHDTLGGELTAEQIAAHTAEHIWRPFEVNKHPLFRVFVVHLTDSECVLGFVAHRSILDRCSVKLLVEEFVAAYAEVSGQSFFVRAKVAPPYAEYIAGYNHWLSSPALHFRLAYWSEYLEGVRGRPSPVQRLDGPRSRVLLSHATEFNASLIGSLIEIAGRLGCELASVLLAATAWTLARTSDQHDVLLLISHDGRHDPKLASVVGSTEDVLLLRVQISHAISLEDAVLCVSKSLRTNRAYHVPYVYIRSAIAHLQDVEAFSSVEFLDFPASDRGHSLPALAEIDVDRNASREPNHRTGPKFVFRLRRDALALTVRYFADEYDEAGITRLVRMLRTMLERGTKLSVERQQTSPWMLRAPEANSQSALLPRISVCGNRFVSSSGGPLLLRGVCIADCQSLLERGRWGRDLFHAARSLGSDIVRIPVHPAAWRQLGETEHLRLLDQAVGWCVDAGLYVILDWHSMGNLHTGVFQATKYQSSLQETVGFWETIAKHFAGCTALAFYELFNEPTHFRGKFGEMSWTQWREINERIIHAIRRWDEEVIPLVAGFDWAYELTQLRYEPIRARGIAYTTHPYACKRPEPWEARWEENFAFAASTYPLIATEFGFSAVDEDINCSSHYGMRITRFLEQRGISWIAWCFDTDWQPPMLESFNDYRLTPSGCMIRNALKRPLCPLLDNDQRSAI